MRRISRINIAFAVFLFFTGCLVTPAISQDAERPNILIMMADDWNWPHLPGIDESIVNTPTFDWLCTARAFGFRTRSSILLRVLLPEPRC